ncbi:MAG: TauD/TfdA family dioxygenase, partial [Quisquiliibacterium sp.]
MAIEFTKLHPTFGARSSAIDLRQAQEPLLQQIRDAMDRYGFLVFPDQRFDFQQQLDFASRLDGP